MNKSKRRILLFLDGNSPAASRVILASTGLVNPSPIDRLVGEGLVQFDLASGYSLTASGRQTVERLRGDAATPG